MSSGAARTLISATIPHASSRSDSADCSAASARTRDDQWTGSFFQLSTTIVGFAVAPTAPNEIAYSSSATLQLSFQMSVAVSAIVRPSGVSVWVSIDTGLALAM
jgi:hypothetical protein